MHYLNAAKLRRQLLPDTTYPSKRSWNGNAAVPENERNQGRHFVEKCSQKQCRACPNRPRTCCTTCKVRLCMEQCFKAFRMS